MQSIGLSQRLLTFPGALCLDVLPYSEIGAAISEYNGFLSNLQRETAGRIIGLGGVPLADMAQAGAELYRVRRDLHLPGIILPSNYFNSIDEAKLLEPLFEAANETNALIMLHPGPKVGEPVLAYSNDFPQYRNSVINLQSQISQTALTLILSDILDHYPKIRFQVVNLGGTLPFVFERMESVARHRNPDHPFPRDKLKRIWYDCASLGPHALEAAVKLYGAERIMMGSDWPIFKEDPWQTAVQPANLSDEEKMLIRYGTATALLDSTR